MPPECVTSQLSPKPFTTVVVPREDAGPRFETVNVHTAFEPTANDPVCDLSSARSVCAAMGTVSESRSLVGSSSPGVLAVA